MSGTYDYRQIQAADEDQQEEAFAELEVADYLVFLLAFDTYLRWLKETGQRADHVFGRGLMLLKMMERDHLEKVNSVLAAGVTNPGSLKMLQAAMRLPSSTSGASMRALKLRTIVSRGGTATAKHIFGTSIRARKEVTDAIEAATTDDAPTALTKFAGITLKNKRLEKWIRGAADTAGKPFVAVNPAHEATKQVAEDGEVLRDQKIAQDAARPDSEAHADAQVAQANTLARIENAATEAAAKALETVKGPDAPVTRSQATGIATAVATAVANDPRDLKNIPPAFINKGIPLDPEQMDAAQTNGKVLVAAGAGAGKSTTLVSRVAYLVDNQGTNPTRIMAVTFNKKAALELQEKLQKKLGADRGKSVVCDTMHTVFRKFIIGDPKMGIPAYGTPEEVRMMTQDLIAPPRPGVMSKVKPGDISRAINTMWNQCNPDQLAAYTGWPKSTFEEGAPKSKKAGLYINKWAGNDVSYTEAKANARAGKEQLAALYYEFYLGLKGDIPNWRPPCGGDGFSKFMDRYRRGRERLGDMDDMLKIFRDILRRDPKAKAAIQGTFDHILIDEAQDSNTIQHQIFDMMSEKIECDDKKKSIWLVGDDRQCVSVDTPISVPGGVKQAVDLVPGDSVLAFRNGENVEQTVRHVVPSSWTWGYRVTTESGKSLLMSPNHKLWATSPTLEEGDSTIVYLMYRKDMGFRVGVTNHCEDESNPFGRRTLSERAERLWILDLAPSRDEALYLEESYSLKYGIPTMVFEGANRGLNQERIARVFQAFGMNGAKLLEERHLSFDLPNWMAYSNSKGKADRRTIQLIMHAAKGSQVALEWSGDDFDIALEGVRYENLAGGRHRLRRFFTNYREALTFAEDIKKKTGANLRKRLATPEGPLSMLTASALVLSMSVPVRSGDTVINERIVAIEKVEGRFVDLDVDDASNFFGGDILSSNSIYQFRGAKPELFQKHWGDGCWKPKMIRTNYRCPPEVVEVANKLVSYNEDRLPVDAMPSPYKARGEASVHLEIEGDNAAAAIDTLHDIRKDLDEDPKKYRPEDYAVLARTNKELNDFETACIINEIPYMRRGGHGFLDAPESRAVLGYIDLASGTNFEKKQKSLVDALMKPDRGLFLGPDKIEIAVKEAVDDVARYEHKDVKDVDPEIILTSRDYSRRLAEYLKGPYKNQLMAKGQWLWNKVVDQLQRQILDMGRDVGDIRRMTMGGPDVKTQQLLEFVLDNVKGTQTNWDPNIRREVTTVQTLRENITQQLKLSDDADDDDDETTSDDESKPKLDEEGRPVVEKKEEAEENPAKGLGAVQFLYALSEPNKNDHDLGILPDTAAGFTKKLERYAKIAETLRIDLRAWEKQQARITDPALRQEKPPAVTLTTVHAVKGLEWPHVTVLMPKGVFPIELKRKKGEPPPTPEEQKEHDISERNLAYVALTRAAKNLSVISIPDPKSGAQSPYIEQSGLAPGENVPKAQAPTPVPEVVTAGDFTVAKDEADLDSEAVASIAMWPDDAGPISNYDRRTQ